jgi:erythromycin esterase
VDHMWTTIERLLDFSGENAKGIVWAHNTHVGDSRATSMSFVGQYNIGALSRIHLGDENVFIVGFGKQMGKVNAGRSWGAPMQIMKVPKAKKGSLDFYLGQIPHNRFLIMFGNDDKEYPLLSDPLEHRAIGVVYDPRNEEGNYVPTLPAHRYNALIFFQETKPLTPVH